MKNMRRNAEIRECRQPFNFFLNFFTMKKQILSLSALAMLAFGSFAYANNATNVKTQPPTTGEEEAIYCDVTIGGNHATCWFCSCSALAESLR
jgi:hypothetical protein